LYLDKILDLSAKIVLSVQNALLRTCHLKTELKDGKSLSVICDFIKEEKSRKL